MLMKTISILILSALGLLLFSCNDSIVMEDVAIRDSSEKMSFAIVRVPYRSPYGPKVVDDIFAGSIDRFNPDGNDLPPPSSFGCFVSWANPKNNSKYLYYTNYVYLPNDLIEQARNIYQHVKVRALSPEGPNGETMGLARCILPSNLGIENLIIAHLKTYLARTEKKVKIEYDVSSQIIDSTLYINTDNR